MNYKLYHTNDFLNKLISECGPKKSELAKSSPQHQQVVLIFVILQGFSFIKMNILFFYKVSMMRKFGNKTSIIQLR